MFIIGKRHGIFDPLQVQDMFEELQRGDVLGETEREREDRAAAIICRTSGENDKDENHDAVGGADV